MVLSPHSILSVDDSVKTRAPCSSQHRSTDNGRNPADEEAGHTQKQEDGQVSCRVYGSGHVDRYDFQLLERSYILQDGREEYHLGKLYGDGNIEKSGRCRSATNHEFQSWGAADGLKGTGRSDGIRKARF